MAYETGRNTWRRSAWPAGCATGCEITLTPLYLTPGLKLSFASPTSGGSRYEVITPPIRPSRSHFGRGQSSRWVSERPTWPQWLVDDQRESSGRPDVLAFVSNP
ncbi:MAG: hypothetical protein U1G07_12700 [Verrucomicrobiota bacterium]